MEKLPYFLHKPATPLLVSLCLIGNLASARTVLYEGFDYPAGDVDGSQTGGTGFAEDGWTTSGSNNPFDIISPGLSTSGVPGIGGAVERPNAPGGAEMHRDITSVSESALTADDSTIWFSVLLRTDGYSVGNANMALILGTGPITNNAEEKPVNLSGGEGIGVSINGDSGESALNIHGYISDDGTASYSTGFLPDANGSENAGVVEMIAGKIEWAANGSEDTLHLFHITDASAPEPADSDAFATMTADLDQSLFGTIAIGTQQISALDEVRYGSDFTSVTGVLIPSAPTPSGRDRTACRRRRSGLDESRRANRHRRLGRSLVRHRPRQHDAGARRRAECNHLHGQRAVGGHLLLARRFPYRRRSRRHAGHRHHLHLCRERQRCRRHAGFL